MMGEEIGLLNPIRPVEGWVSYPNAPGWGAEWDWNQFEKKRIAVL
jgi:L-alanine-DL-glutamate epimerase-like enolase superfamily enzyme